jgi:hypothetical protein
MTTDDKPTPPRIRFRFHRGSLADSMATERFIYDDLSFRKAVEEFVRGGPCAGPPNLELIERTHVKPYGDGPDTRVGWERTYIVTVDGFGVVGFCDGTTDQLPMWGGRPMTTDDKPTPRFPLGPSDTFNGVPWKDFCEACRAALDDALRAGATSAKLCDDCAALLVERGRIVATDDRRHPIGVSSDGTILFAPTEPPALEHAAPWRWINDGTTLVAADHVEWTEDDDGHDSVVLNDRIMCIPDEMSPLVRELVRAAPEMEALLRWFVERVGDVRPSHPNVAAAIKLLARIDAAKAPR